MAAPVWIVSLDCLEILIITYIFISHLIAKNKHPGCEHCPSGTLCDQLTGACVNGKLALE
jgi:hypothetical protein